MIDFIFLIGVWFDSGSGSSAAASYQTIPQMTPLVLVVVLLIDFIFLIGVWFDLGSGSGAAGVLPDDSPNDSVGVVVGVAR